MPNYTYVSNTDPSNKTNAISLRGGALVIGIGQYANITSQELLEILQTGEYNMQPGIVSNATPVSPQPSTSNIPTWSANTVYPAGYVIQQAGAIYYATVGFTSGSTFNAANWTVIAATPGTIIANPTLITSSGALSVATQTECDCTSGAQTQALPTGASAGTFIAVEKYDATTNTLTLTGNIRGVGSSSIVLSLQHETLGLIADGSGSWWPAWSHKTLGSLDARYQESVRTVSASTTITTADANHTIQFDATSGAIAQSLPAPASFTGKITLVAITTGTNLVTLTVTGGGNIVVPGLAGASSLTLGTPTSGAAFQSVDVLPSGSSWVVI